MVNETFNKENEHQFNADASVIAPILDFLSEAVIWAIPIFDSTHRVVDFEVGYANKSANEIAQHSKGDIIGLRILRDGLPNPETAGSNFESLLTVYQTNEIKDYTVFGGIPDHQFESVRRSYHGGVLSTTYDRSDLRKAQRKEYEKTRLLDGVIEHASAGIVVYESIRDQADCIIDFKAILFNDVIHQLTGITKEERSRYTFRELMRSLNSEDLYFQYKKLVETGVPFSLEYFNQRVVRWLQVSVNKLGDGFIAILTDISALKLSEENLKKESAFSGSILNASLNGIYVLESIRDPGNRVKDFIFLTGNQKYTELTGRSIEGLLGKSFLENFPYTKENGFFDTMSGVVETGKPHKYVAYYAPAFQRWYDILAVKLEEDKVLVTFQDVTQHREAAVHIEQQKNLLDNILKNSSNGIAVTEVVRNDQGVLINARTIMANDAAIKITGLKEDAYYSKTAIELFTDFIGVQYLDLCTKTLETGDPSVIQCHYKSSDTWFELTISRMDNDHLIHVFTDITSIMKAQQELERTVTDLKRSNQSLEEFAFAASHDLQEPLRKIHIFSDQIRQSLFPLLNESHHLMFERIKSATSRMRDLIKDLLAYSQVTRTSEENEYVDLNEIIDQVTQDLEGSIIHTGAEIHIGNMPSINGNKQQLRQLFQNLLSNALKYSKPEISPEISITCKKTGEAGKITDLIPQASNESYYIIEVKDNGIGFEQEHAEKIFQVFQRLHGKAEYEGTGVGLAIVQKVVRNHRGFIIAEGEPGKGSIFKIILPINEQSR